MADSRPPASEGRGGLVSAVALGLPGTVRSRPAGLVRARRM